MFLRKGQKEEEMLDTSNAVIVKENFLLRTRCWKSAEDIGYGQSMVGYWLQIQFKLVQSPLV